MGAHRRGGEKMGAHRRGGEKMGAYPPRVRGEDWHPIALPPCGGGLGGGEEMIYRALIREAGIGSERISRL